jgi:hypothetical protein
VGPRPRHRPGQPSARPARPGPDPLAVPFARRHDRRHLPPQVHRPERRRRGEIGHALSANMRETVTPWEFRVEGEAGLESDERTGAEPGWASDRGGGLIQGDAPVKRTDQVVSRHPGQRVPDKTDRTSIGLCATGRRQEASTGCWRRSRASVLIVSEQSRLGRDTIRTLAPSSVGGALRQ